MNLDTPSPPVLHLVCGKIAAGKSTLTRRLTDDAKAVLIGEDVWLSKLYPGEICSVGDYVRRSAQLRNALAPHIESLLRSGLSVVLDFPANTVGNRGWMKNIYEHAGASHVLHYLDIPDDVCKMRLHVRNASQAHAFAPSDAEFDEITRYFVPPSDDEGFHVVRYKH